MYRSTNHLRPGLADFGQACGMAVLRTNLDAAPGLDVGLELLSRPGPNLRWNGVVEIQASDGNLAVPTCQSFPSSTLSAGSSYFSSFGTNFTPFNRIPSSSLDLASQLSSFCGVRLLCSDSIIGKASFAPGI